MNLKRYSNIDNHFQKKYFLFNYVSIIIMSVLPLFFNKYFKQKPVTKPNIFECDTKPNKKK